MQQVKIFCDTCGKEGEKGSGGSTFAGVIARFTTDLQRQGYRFAEDYCNDCSELILNFISELKKDIKEQTDKNKEK